MLTIDGRPARAEGTVLDACASAGAEVPAFCHDGRFSAGGHCRACLVEVDGKHIAACATPARPGMRVLTDTGALRAYRRDLGELMLSESRPAGRVAAALAAWGADGSRYGLHAPGAAADRSHPYLRLDLDRCILCRQCARACDEVQGQFVYAFEGRGAGTRLAWGGGPFAASSCVSCGACVASCPTGAILDADREAGEGAAPPAVRTTCGYCGVGCQLDVQVEDDRVRRIEGTAAAPNHGHLCVKGRYAHAFARHDDRLTAPLVRRGGVLVRASWDEAIALVAERLERSRGKVAGLSSSRCTNEENYLFQKWMRGGLGTNDVDCCARVCHAPSAAGMRESFGIGAATNGFDDIERADLLLVAGANVTEAHPVAGARIKQAVLRGARLIVIDPRRTELAAMADVHLQVRPGANVPLLNSIAAVLVEEGLIDRGFIAERVEGWEEFREFIGGEAPERWEETTGVPAPLVRKAARLHGSAARPMMLHGLGVTEHYQGSEAVMLLANLALLTGAVGREGVGVNPLRGQNNVQGAADMGCQPDLLTGYAAAGDPLVRARFEAVWGRPVPAAPGRRIPEMYDAALRGEVRAMFIFGEDVAQTDPDSTRTRRALEALDFIAVEEIFLSETARLAHVVLPGASFLEKDGTFTSGERRIQRVRRALEPPGEARADLDILLALMAATGWPQPLRSAADVMREVASVAPAFAGVSFERLEEGGLQWPVPSVDHPGTPILHRESFARGRGKLARVEYIPSPGLGTGLILTTGRVLEHYNAGSMTRRTPNRLISGRDALEIHPRDAAARGIAGGDTVIVASAHGEARAAARVTDRVAPGVVFLSFHFPETGTNAVTGNVLDRISGCPEYKVTAVEVHRTEHRPSEGSVVAGDDLTAAPADGTLEHAGIAGVSVVTVTCGQRPDLLRRTLQAARASGAGLCVVVHNSSEPADERFYAELAVELGGRLVLSRTGENRGSAGGYRRGLELAGSLADCEYIWLLDDDNLPDPGALAALMATHEDLSAHVPRDRIALASLRPDREYLARVASGAAPEAVFPRRGSFLGFHWRDGLRKLQKLVSRAAPVTAAGGDVAVEIPFAPYGGLFLHKSVVARIGLPDERFFLYGDDMEYTNRLVEQGGKLILVPPSRVIDADPSWGAKAGRRSALTRLLLAESEFRVFYSVRNQVYFETRRWKGRPLEYLLNRMMFFALLGLLATWHARWARAALIWRAARLGRQGRLERGDEPGGP